jgi:hypothetical protein
MDKGQEMVVCKSQSTLLKVNLFWIVCVEIRYAVQTSMSDSKATAFGKHFIANFAPEIMKSYLHHIDLYMSRKIWLSERCVYLIVDFLEEWYSLHLTMLIQVSNRK